MKRLGANLQSVTRSLVGWHCFLTVTNHKTSKSSAQLPSTLSILVGSIFFGLVLLFAWCAQADSLDVLAGQMVALGLPGVTTNYSYDSVTIEAGGTVTIAGNVTLNVVSNVLVNGNVDGSLTGRGDDGAAGGDGADGTLISGSAQSGGDGGDGENGKSLSGGAALTIYASTMTVNGSIRMDMALDGGDGGDSGGGGNGADGASPQPGRSNGGDGGLGGSGGFSGNGGNGGGAAFLQVTLQPIYQNGTYVGGSFVLGTNGVISLENSSKGGNGGAGGNAGDGGTGGDSSDPANCIFGGRGGTGGLAGWGGSGGSGGNGGSLEIDARMVDLEGHISLKGGDGGDGGDAGIPGNGGDGGNACADAGDASDAYSCSDVGPPCTEAGSGGNGGNGGTFFVETTWFTNHATIDLSGGSGGNGGQGQAAGIGTAGHGGPACHDYPAGKDGLPSLAVPDGYGGSSGADGDLNFTSLSGNSFASQAVYGWKTVGDGSFSFGGIGLTLSSSGPFTVFGELVHPQYYYDAIAGKQVAATNAPVEFAIGYKWQTTTGSLDVVVAGKIVLHLDAPSVLPHGFATADLILPPQLPLSTYYSSFHGLDVRFQLNDGGSVFLQNLSVKLQPTIPWLTISQSPGPPPALNLFWFGATNENYQVQSRLSLNTGLWTNVNSSVLGQGDSASMELPVAPNEPTYFYRLKMTPAN